MKKEVYPAIDIAKFMMAILVVAIHVRPFGGTVGFIYNDVIARIADPLFFSITAFFLFQKAFAEEKPLSWTTLGVYMIRIGKLYGAWVLIYSPVMIQRAVYVTGGGIRCVLYILRSVFLSGPYGALWFLTALLLAIPLTYLVAKKLHPAAAPLLALPFFVFLVLELGYTELVCDIPAMESMKEAVQNIFIWLWNGLTFGFFFCALGMWAAYCRQTRRKSFGGKNSGIGLLICIAFLFAEAFLIRTNSLGSDYAAMFSLIPLTWFLLQWLLYVPCRERKIYAALRKSGILIFTIHYGLMEAFRAFFSNSAWYIKNTTVQYVFVLGATLLCAAVILYLSRHVRRCSWMKILY